MHRVNLFDYLSAHLQQLNSIAVADAVSSNTANINTIQNTNNHYYPLVQQHVQQYNHQVHAVKYLIVQ